MVWWSSGARFGMFICHTCKIPDLSCLLTWKVFSKIIQKMWPLEEDICQLCTTLMENYLMRVNTVLDWELVNTVVLWSLLFKDVSSVLMNIHWLPVKINENHYEIIWLTTLSHRSWVIRDGDYQSNCIKSKVPWL